MEFCIFLKHVFWENHIHINRRGDTNTLVSKRRCPIAPKAWSGGGEVQWEAPIKAYKVSFRLGLVLIPAK